jgi:hypothetical protein
MMLQCLRIRQVNGVCLMSIFCDIGKVQSQSFTESSELDFSLVLQAEPESLLGNLLKSSVRTTPRGKKFIKYEALIPAKTGNLPSGSI